PKPARKPRAEARTDRRLFGATLNTAPDPDAPKSARRTQSGSSRPTGACSGHGPEQAQRRLGDGLSEANAGPEVARPSNRVAGLHRPGEHGHTGSDEDQDRHHAAADSGPDRAEHLAGSAGQLGEVGIDRESNAPYRRR